MNLHDLPVAFEDPLETLFAFHRRVERQLATLCRLPVQLEVNGVDATTIAAASGLVEFFSTSLPKHHADEEHELFPLIERCLAGRDEGREFRELRQRLDLDCRDIHETWRRLRRPLEAVAEGLHRQLPPELTGYFRSIHSVHIATEESGVHMLAMRRFGARDYAALARGMRARCRVIHSPRL